MKTIAVATIGCKTNQYETEAILNQFIKSGYKLVDFSQSADIYLINTCCVTNRAEYKSRYLIRKAIVQKKNNTNIVVTGCYVENDSDFLHQFNDKILTFNNNEKSQIFNFIVNNSKRENTKSFSNQFIELTTDKFYLHTRVPIKVQDGCDFFCSYCILPYVRGKPRSRKQENVITQVKKLVKNGVKEIVLTGINLGLYGREFADYSLIELLTDLSTKTDIQRIRLSSIEPMFFYDRFIEYLATNQKICPHFHIPLQSGSDTVLNKMNRYYNSKDFIKIIIKIKNEIPDAAIGCDVIVGFPGETDAEFEKTFSFVDKLDISYMHIFRYSPRPKTASSYMKWKSNGVKNKHRMHQLLKLNAKKKKKYFNYLIDNKIPLKAVLEKQENGMWTSVSDHYARVYLKDENAKKGELKNLVAKKIHSNGNGILGEKI
ncbi:MAG: tRNA (N(6)-L-threonylcarbamoyladenosine(37)-C(2))-methylthiotransferase MtaB [Candidatus Cloacimonetes bacterium]|nr:tRNA (N(6)-L-threonylcarbamoyladenosine(37)-C(2))-methylthiotransferase MtaB [Candidatus Cloacimonadota bacterium]MBL7085975.1 tRNA (N(6)-L-threonylcarbamoyladenosine(37)-C(2))-methylthiotransferase MtaB [Candidatus Cloacimonadota bacterium]